MKVLFLTNVPAPYRVDFFNEIGKSVDLTVLFERDNAKCRNAEWVSDNFKNFKFHFLKGIHFKDDGTISFKVKRFLKENYDIVLFGNYHTPTSVIASRYCIKKHIPYGLSIDGIFKPEEENKIKLKLKKMIFSHADFFVTTGNYSVEVIHKYGGKNCYIYPFTSVYKEYVLDRPIDEKEKEALKQTLGLTNKTILFVGQIIPRKGIDVLLKVYKKLSQYELVIIGGELIEPYCSMAKEWDLKIKVIPFLNSIELQKYYLAADVFLLPTREDQWGLVVNEALAKGLPVVSTDRCLSCYEMIKGNGKMVEVDNVDQMVLAVEEILNSEKEVYSLYQQKALEVAKEYTIEKMAERHLEIFDDVIKKR